MSNLPKLIVDFEEVDKEDIPLVGGKGANLGEMVSAGFPVPLGFMLTTNAYTFFLSENRLENKLYKILDEVDSKDPTQLQNVSAKIAEFFKKGEFPTSIKKETIDHYRKLGGVFRKALVAVRSSATAEDLPSASFAGQQATFLNVQGEAHLFQAIRECWASLFTARAIFYRLQNKIPHEKVAISVVVQEMVQPEISGVAFTVDPVTQEKNVMLIEAIWGLGELVVQGAVVPDVYRVDRNTLDIISIKVNSQEVELVKAGRDNKEKKIPITRRNKQKLDKEEIRELAKILRDLHKHYFFPQDIEWTYQKNKFYIVQTRPITTLEDGKSKIENRKDTRVQIPSSILHNPVLKGIAASPGVGTGPVVKVKSLKELSKVKRGDVLVTVMTSPDYVTVMKKVSAIVTDSGGQTSHAAIVSRELGVPCVVGTKNATSFLAEGTIVTVDGAKGLVYKGGFKTVGSREYKQSLAFQARVESRNIPESSLKTATKVYVNLGEPDKAAEIAGRNVDGVGLLRAEFIMANIGVHPKKAIKDKKQKGFVETLSKDLEKFCEAFYPRPVVYRATDFKTNEYRNLKGGKDYEPEEPNPLLGFRGAFRYVNNPDVFNLELEALKKVRERGLKNIWLMIPFVRSPKELMNVKRLVAAAGLLRSPTFKLWLMVELPVNVILLPEFIKVGIDGVSIGSNDLTMLMTGTDRDNETVAPVFDERSPSVLWAIRHVITICNKLKITSSICGQAPSTFDDLVEQIVSWGITSISVNPDSIERVREVVYNTERRVVNKVNG